MQHIWLWKRIKYLSNSIDFSLWLKSGLLFKKRELVWHYQVETVVKVTISVTGPSLQQTVTKQ